MRRTPPPLWFALTIAALWIALAHALGWHDLEAPPVTQAFLGFLLTLVGWIWNGIQVAGQAAVASLTWAVSALWGALQLAYNVLVELGQTAMAGLQKTWQFFRYQFKDILRAGWTKFWKLVDTVRATLEHVLQPVFDALRALRDHILQFYTKWVRPVLDTIEVTRKMLRVLSALHLEWARKLDAKLGQLEEQIDRPFRFALGEINKVINLVNRVVTADGLFQRLALVKSIARDWKIIGDEYAKWHKPPMTEEELKKAKLQEVLPLPAWEPGQELGKFYRGEGGAYDGIINELAPDWKVAAGLKAP